MAKQTWKPGNMIYPLPAVMVSTADKEGNSNILTIAWTGTVCTNPPMAYRSVRPERYSYHMIKESGEFVINLTTKKLSHATDYCGVRSGRDVDKWKECRLTKGSASSLEYAPVIEEAPASWVPTCPVSAATTPSWESSMELITIWFVCVPPVRR